ncbi:MAG: hypothetical protein DRP93_05985 [Candidatus Neomarinimicrobiota bacterium]|nr:MAG: hypothetical protein DRP93_05985 [Candidatus Neomarinimicrobiota bacterium]
MNISYSDPLSLAWTRMKKALFQPFDLSKWFTIGFTAFLATLIGGPGSGGGGNYSQNYGDNNLDWEEIANFPQIAWQWLMENSLWFSLIIVGVVLLFIILVVLTWLSSRGKFMFLENVIHDKAEVSKPWHDYKKLGDSLFSWRLIFGVVSFIIIMLSLMFSFVVVVNLFSGYSSIPTKVFSIMGLVLQFTILMTMISYISLFLDSFVVPIMYKHKIPASQAWDRFLPLLSKYPWYFLLYGIFVFALWIIVVIGIVLFGLFTCCIGFLLLVIPFIGSVVILPVTYTFRVFSVGFLEQFGEDFTLFPNVEETNIELTEG